MKKPKAFEFTVNARREGPHGSVARCKEAQIQLDTDLRGRQDAFDPSELLLAALSACMIKEIEGVSPMIHFKCSGIQVHLHGVRQHVPPRISHIDYAITVDTDETDARLELLHDNVRKFSTIFNTLAPATELKGTLRRTDHSQFLDDGVVDPDDVPRYSNSDDANDAIPNAAIESKDPSKRIKTLPPQIEVFDPPMCCSTGICGPGVDPALTRFAADLQWLATQGVGVVRYNLSQQPQAFVANPMVKEMLTEGGNDSLPLIVLDGSLLSKGKYLSREQLAHAVNVPFGSLTQPVATKSCCS